MNSFVLKCELEKSFSESSSKCSYKSAAIIFFIETESINHYAQWLLVLRELPIVLTFQQSWTLYTQLDFVHVHTSINISKYNFNLYCM